MSSTDQKLDRIQGDIGEIKTHLAVYNQQLKVHIKRSDMLEEKLKPIEKHVAMLQGALKLIGIIAIIAAIIEHLSKVI